MYTVHTHTFSGAHCSRLRSISAAVAAGMKTKVAAALAAMKPSKPKSDQPALAAMKPSKPKSEPGMKKPAKAERKAKAEPKAAKAEPTGSPQNNADPDLPTPGMTLQQNIEGFRRLIMRQKAKGGGAMPDAKKLLRSWFTDGEMSNLWGKLKRFMATKAQPQTKEEWASIDAKKAREGKNEAKSSALVLSLAMPENWEQTWVSECTKITDVKEKSVRKTKFYRGELEQLHGVAEAADFIARKKYIEEEDSDGDTVYVKKQEQSVDKKIHSTEAETKNQSRTTQDAQTVLLEQMEAWFNDDQGAILDKGTKTMKRPAAAIQGGRSARKARKNAAELVNEGDKPDDQGEKPEEKATKTPLEEARSKAGRMAQSMSLSSAKLLSVASNTKKDALTGPLLSSIAESRKSLEAKRGQLLQLSCSPKSTVKEIKDATLVAAKIEADSRDLVKLARPFSKAPKPARKVKAQNA